MNLASILPARDRRSGRTEGRALPLVIALLLLTCPMALPAGADGWVLQCVDCPESFSDMTDRSLRLDPGGHPHLAYGQDGLYHAWHDGSQWHTETVDSSPGVGRYATLDLSASGEVHMGYFDAIAGDLLYARQGAGNEGLTAWQVEVVDTGLGSTGGYGSLALAPGGTPHLSYYDGTLGALIHAVRGEAGWQIDTVDADLAPAGGTTSLALDPDGVPAIAYFDYSADQLKFARASGGLAALSWQIEVVDTVLGWDSSAGHASLAMDGAGTHISYYSVTDDEFRYAFQDAAGRGALAWQIELVADGLGGVGGYNSLAVDAVGQPHISFMDAYRGSLKYATRQGDIWQIELVDGQGFAGRFNAIALDGGGIPHVSYFEDDAASLNYAYQDGSDWLIETVAVSGDAGAFSCLALESGDRPIISYRDAAGEMLKLARRPGTGWESETVDGMLAFSSVAIDQDDHAHVAYWRSNGLRYAYQDANGWHIDAVATWGWFPSLALGGDGYPRIAYQDLLAGTLVYAYKDIDGWHKRTVDAAGRVGEHASLALDASGNPHISYFDATNGALKYAWHDGLAWTTSVVDAGPETGWFTSLALDSLGLPHISYLDWGLSQLRYARWDGLQWQIETVDAEGLTGYYTSMSLDAAGSPHIGYRDATLGDLRYARQAPGELGSSAWHLEVVDSAGNTGGHVSLALDGGDSPHLSYYDLTNQDLRYAFWCRSVTGVSLAGPDFLVVGEGGDYIAAFTPLTATAPISYNWNSGAVGPTAVYSWTEPGSYSVEISATNACGAAATGLTVEVCQPVEGVDVSGPGTLAVGESGVYVAAYAPVTTSLPVTVTWDNGTVGPSAVYSWTVPGAYTPTVTVLNRCGEAAGSLAVLVGDNTRWIYLPLVMR